MKQSKANQEGEFIPILSGQAGNCLTLANWQEAGVQTIAYYLDELLVKPGLSLLSQLTDIKDYIAWSGHIVLNGTALISKKEEIYTIRSPYDGSVITISIEALLALVVKLKPDKVILPLDTHHVHFPKLDKPYKTGDVELKDLIPLLKNGYDVQTNRPSWDGINGLFYTHDGIMNVLSPEMMNHHESLDKDCTCNTCKENLTRAYLHHLLQHTPLLAQRYLVQHNVTFVIDSSKNC